MFGFSGTTGFGQPAQQPAPAFGAQPASPFGAAFGQPAQPAASPFGAATGSAPLFGAQSPAPAFGQAAPAAATAFGATTGTAGFGTGAFGAAAKPAGFGGFGTTTTAAPNPFGAPAQTPGAFGAPAQSAPAFGAGLGTAPSFGATLTPAPAFGAASAPAFGAPQSAPAFGGFGAASAPAFGAAAAAPANPFGATTTTGFGATAAPAFGAAPAATGFGAPAAPAAAPFGTTTTNLFGAPSAAPSPFGAAAPTQPAAGFGGFGAAPVSGPTNGTRTVPYSKTKDPDAPAGQPTFLVSISALPNFQAPSQPKSHEELRWEDYQEGVKNQSAGPAPAAAGAFGAPAPAAAAGFGGFGAATQPPATTGFGAAAPANPFGAPAAAPAFGAATTPAFGAASQPSLFGATAAAPAAAASNPFGAATAAPAFGGFGAAPAAAASQPSMFGTTTTTGFGTAAPFGSTTPFGGASSAAAFSFNSSPSTFGAASAPATSLFGTAPASSPFGGTNSTLGAVGSPFGAASSASAFGTSTFGAFGTTAAKPASPFGAPAAATPFGTAAPAATGTSIFGGATPFSFSSQPAASPSLFGNTAAGGSTMSFATNLFGQTAAAPAAGGGLFGTAAAAPPAQPPTVAQPAYGNFGTLPSVPDAKVGITTRAARNTSINSGASKASPLLSLRPTPLRYGASVRARTEQPSGLGMGMASSLPPAGPPLVTTAGGIAIGASDLLTPQVPSGVGSTAAAAAVAAAAAGGTGLLPFRQNPHRLFIAAPPPSTEAAGGSSFLTPARPPSVQRASTPDGAAAADDLGHVEAGTPPGGGRHAGVNGYANGFASGSAAATGAAPAGPSSAAAPATTAAAAAGAGRGPAFQDAPTSEPHLPRLGRLVSEGFSFSPNVDELRLLNSQNPENLAAVSNFTVSRASVGQVRWVVPVDVRGLALYDIVSISYGEVLCYPDASTKPPQGQGLNKPAEITLYGVYKKDKETGAPIKDGPRGQAYEKPLRQMCGRMGAKFLSYKLDGGVWKFEVEHFSRYGLIDMDDDDPDMAAPPATAGTPAARGDAQAAAAAAAAAAAPPEEGVGEAPVPRRPGLDGDAGAPAGQPALAGRGLAGFGLRGFAFGGGGPAASAAGCAPVLVAGEDSGMEPSVGARWQQRGQQGGGGDGLPEAGGSEATGVMGAGNDQDMSEACAQLRFGDDLMAEGEVSGGVVGPAARAAAAGGGAGDSTDTEPPPPGTGEGGGGWAPSQPAAPLQHALPDSLAQDPVRVRALHDAFFSSIGGGGGGGGGAGAAASRLTQQQQQRLALTAAASTALPVEVTASGGAAGARAAAAAAAAATAANAVTAWRRPAPSLVAGAPAAVAARGEELLSAADGGFGFGGGGGFLGGGGAGGVSSSPISLALARPVTTRPVSAIADGAAAAVLPLRDVRTAGNLTDAGLAMGRGFRVGWGPGGRLAVPGAADATTATEICITRVRVEGEGAAYGEASYGSGGATGGAAGAAATEDAEGLEALRDRLRAGLDVHLAASKMERPGLLEAEAEGAKDGPDGAVAVDGAALVPYWRLCIDSRELSVLVSRHVQVCKQQLQQLLGGGAAADGADPDHPDALRLRHEIETWRLVETLFAKIDGEVPEAAAPGGGSAGLSGGSGEESPAGATLRPLGDVGSPPAAGTVDGGGGGGGTDMMVLSTPPKTGATATPSDYDMAADGGGGEGAGAAGGGGGGSSAGTSRLASPVKGGSRTLLAAQQRRAQLSLWLQRQARRRVEEDLAAASGGSPAGVVLNLMAGHQLAAAVGAAVAVGDPRLAMLIARAGSRQLPRAYLATQLALWQQSDFLDHVAPERLAAVQLLAGEVLEPQRLMSLDWRRLLGLYLWYGTPNTASPVDAMKRYVMDRHAEPAVVPHPAPYHVEGLQPSATGGGAGGAAGALTHGSTDVQWELLQLWSTTRASAVADCLAAGCDVAAGDVAAAARRALAGWLAGGGCSRLLRCSGYSPNPLDHSLAWYLMTALQSIGVLPAVGSGAADTEDDYYHSSADAASSASVRAQYDNEVLTTALEFISQLNLAGALSEWAVFVAMTLPDLPTPMTHGSEGSGSDAASGSALRRRVVRELLALSVPEWSNDRARESFLSDTLHVPISLLAEARATWAQYTRDDDARCAALLAAGDAAAAHDVFVGSVAPALFLAGAWTQLAQLVEALEPAAAALLSWPTGGGLYGGFLALFGRQLTATAAGAGGGAAAPPPTGLPEGVSLEALDEFAKQVQEAQVALNAAGGGGGSADQVAGAAALLQSTDEATERQRLRRRLVLGRISARVQAVLMSMTSAAAAGGGGGAAAALGWETRCAGLQAGLALQGCLAAEMQLGGVAVAVAEAGARVACS